MELVHCWYVHISKVAWTEDNKSEREKRAGEGGKKSITTELASAFSAVSAMPVCEENRRGCHKRIDSKITYWNNKTKTWM